MKVASSKNPADYKALAEWNRRLGSPASWKIADAVAEGAPIDAIYRQGDSYARVVNKEDREVIKGSWVTVRDLHEGHDFRVWYETEVLRQPVRPRRRIVFIHVTVDLPPGTQNAMTGPPDLAAVHRELHLPKGAFIQTVQVVGR